MKFINKYLKNKPDHFQKDFINNIEKINYQRLKIFSFLLIFISLLMYLIAVFGDDNLIITRINLSFFLVTLILYIILNIWQWKKDENSFFRKLYVFCFVFDALIWGTILVSFIPHRYELFSTYSIVILTISAVVYMKWQVSLLLYLSSLSFVSFCFFRRVTQHFLPKISTLFFLVLIGWLVSRLLYIKEIDTFVAQKSLKQKKENIQQEVLKKSRKLKNYENTKIREIIHSVTNLLDIYDPYTRGHSENVAKMATAIAQKMNLSQTEIKDTYWAGMVHDIGKLLIPLNILNKDDSLNDEEYKLIKKHSQWSYEALKDSPALENIAEYVLYHHERWDGKGYPKGIQGEELPLISQILILADAWDAMRSNRAYRSSLSKREALQEIKDNKGSQFPPEVVDTFLKIKDDLINI